MISTLRKLRALFTASAAPVAAPPAVPPVTAAPPLPIEPEEPDYEAMCCSEPACDDILSRDEEGRLHGSPARVYHHAGSNDVFESRTEYHHDHGTLIARVEYSSCGDEEGSSYEERWHDADGKLHRDKGPAVIVRSDHRIPEETYLDESRVEFWRHGECVSSTDTTYEDIVAHKPLTVRQAFGYDI